LYASNTDLADKSPYDTLRDAALAEAGPLASSAQVSSKTVIDAAGNNCVEVTVSYTFQTLFQYPTIPTETPISRTVRMRVTPINEDTE
jgi:hypothetical protein